jgi:hypothetical protein
LAAEHRVDLPGVPMVRGWTRHLVASLDILTRSGARLARMTQSRRTAAEWDADQVPDDPRAGAAARRRARDHVVLTQPPPPRPAPARPTHGDEDPPPPEPAGTSTDAQCHDELIATIDELIADR